MIDSSLHSPQYATPQLQCKHKCKLSICRALWRILWAKMENLTSKNIF